MALVLAAAMEANDMTRDEKIEILIVDQIWFYLENDDCLGDALFYGFKGYENYTDEELEKEFKELNKVTLNKIKVMLRENKPKFTKT